MVSASDWHPLILALSSALTTTWICFTVTLSSNPKPTGLPAASLDFIIFKIKLQITNCFKLKIHPQINEKERENNNNYLEQK